MTAPPTPRPLALPPAARGPLVFAVAAFSLLFAVNASLSARMAVQSAARPNDDVALASPVAYRAMALGHREWVSDLLWLRALVYYGETVVASGGQRRLQEFATSIEAVDPKFRGAYLWGATVSVYNSRRISRASVENAIGHLERGLVQFPNDGELLEQLGFLCWAEMAPFYRDDTERMAFRRRGATLYQRAAAAGYGPAWLSLSAANALEQVGLDGQAVDHLRRMAMRTDDDAVRARILRRIEDFTGAAQSDPFIEGMRRTDAERRASFPYLPPVLYLMVGPPLPGVAPATAPSAAPTSAPDDPPAEPTTNASATPGLARPAP